MAAVIGRTGALLVLALGAGLASAQTPPTEYQVKAVFLYNFGKFVDWPVAAEDSSFSICVLGEDPFGPALDAALGGEAVGGRPITLRRATRVEEVRDCRILYVSTSEAERVPDLLQALRDRSVLTVSDMEDFARRGGMIQFVAQENRVRFVINLTRASEAGLRMSSQLLKLAVDVSGGPPPPGDVRLALR